MVGSISDWSTSSCGLKQSFGLVLGSLSNLAGSCLTSFVLGWIRLLYRNLPKAWKSCSYSSFPCTRCSFSLALLFDFLPFVPTCPSEPESLNPGELDSLRRTFRRFFADAFADFFLAPYLTWSIVRPDALNQRVSIAFLKSRLHYVRISTSLLSEKFWRYRPSIEAIYLSTPSIILSVGGLRLNYVKELLCYTC